MFIFGESLVPFAKSLNNNWHHVGCVLSKWTNLMIAARFNVLGAIKTGSTFEVSTQLIFGV